MRLNWAGYGRENILTKIAARDLSALAGSYRVALRGIEHRGLC